MDYELAKTNLIRIQPVHDEDGIEKTRSTCGISWRLWKSLPAKQYISRSKSNSLC